MKSYIYAAIKDYVARSRSTITASNQQEAARVPVGLTRHPLNVAD